MLTQPWFCSAVERVKVLSIFPLTVTKRDDQLRPPLLAFVESEKELPLTIVEYPDAEFNAFKLTHNDQLTALNPAVSYKNPL